MIKFVNIKMGEVEYLKKQIKELNKKIIQIENNSILNQKELIKEALKEFTREKHKDTLKSEFIRKFKKNKKEIIKQKIIEIIKIKPMSIADLKYNIVDQLKYCSKASFYRYIEELNNLLEIKNGLVCSMKQVIIS
jgi:hypothetical protein